eukprot:403346001
METTQQNASTGNINLPPYELVFVVEYIRHGHRAPLKILPQNESLYEGTPAGELSKLGQQQLFNLGQQRRKEYLEDHKLLSAQFDPHEILMLSTDFQRTTESLESFLQGLYNLEPSQLYYQVDHNEHLFSPLDGTNYQVILDAINRQTCSKRPIVRVPYQIDSIMGHKSSTELREFITKDKFDIIKVESKIKEIFADIYVSNQADIKRKFDVTVTNLREYFDMADQMVCDYSITDPKQTLTYFTILTYILANNFEHVTTYFKQLYHLRLMKPLVQVIKNAQELQKAKRPIILKYLVHGLHDFNLAQILEFLNYYELKGWNNINPINFGSNIRFELLQKADTQDIRSSQIKDNDFKIRIVYDDDVLHLSNEDSENLLDFDKFIQFCENKLHVTEQELIEKIQKL